MVPGVSKTKGHQLQGQWTLSISPAIAGVRADGPGNGRGLELRASGNEDSHPNRHQNVSHYTFAGWPRRRTGYRSGFVTDDVVARMLEHDAQQEAQLGGYTATRHYLVAHKRSKAEMKVALTCAEDGVKEFKILSEEGSFAIRTLVLHRMLKEEAEASHPRNPHHHTHQTKQLRFSSHWEGGCRWPSCISVAGDTQAQ